MNTKGEKTYNLEDRTIKFAKDIVVFVQGFKRDPLLMPILTQLVRAGTSIGANYCEANGASSKKDFTNKIFICKKESKETKYWLRMLAKAVEELKGECQDLWREAQEYTLIFSKIAANLKADRK